MLDLTTARADVRFTEGSPTQGLRVRFCAVTLYNLIRVMPA